jgi:hypothetical protein
MRAADVRIYLEAERAYRASVFLSETGTDLVSHRNAAGGRLEAAAADKPWSADEIGAAFEGPFLAEQVVVLEAWRRVSDFVEGMGAAAAEAVVIAVQANHEALTQGVNPGADVG